MTTYTKSIIYDAETRDFAMLLNGEVVGWARTYREAEDTLDALVTDLITRDAATIAAHEAAAALDTAAAFAAGELPLVPTAQQVADACLDLAIEFDDAAASHDRHGNAAAAKELRSAAKAARKASFYAIEAARVARWHGDVLLVRSATDSTVYAVRASGCCCKAGVNNRPCWHYALRQAHERALDTIDLAPLPSGLALAA
jgi:hypothetical protein